MPKSAILFVVSFGGILALGVSLVIVQFFSGSSDAEVSRNLLATAIVTLLPFAAYGNIRMSVYSSGTGAPPLLGLGAPRLKMILAEVYPDLKHPTLYWELHDERIYEKLRFQGVAHSQALIWAYLTHGEQIDFHEAISASKAVSEHNGDPIRYAYARNNGVDDPELAVLVSADKLAHDLAVVM
jgi:hypothetical protein